MVRFDMLSMSALPYGCPLSDPLPPCFLLLVTRTVCVVVSYTAFPLRDGYHRPYDCLTCAWADAAPYCNFLLSDNLSSAPLPISLSYSLSLSHFLPLPQRRSQAGGLFQMSPGGDWWIGETRYCHRPAAHILFSRSPHPFLLPFLSISIPPFYITSSLLPYPTPRLDAQTHQGTCGLRTKRA
jgi:hypothetical protein